MALLESLEEGLSPGQNEEVGCYMNMVDIVTSEMHLLHGVNRVTEKLIMGHQQFYEEGICLRRIISNDGVENCVGYKSKLGAMDNLDIYRKKRKAIERLKKLPLYSSKVIQGAVLLYNYIQNRRVVKYFHKEQEMPELIIFQDPITAIYFLRHSKYTGKSVFITHAASDPLEQVLLNRPAIKGTYIERKLRRDLAFLYHSVNNVITICNSSRVYLKKKYGLDCPCIINGIEDFYNSGHEKYSQKDKKIHFVITASVQYRKGQDIAVAAFSHLSEDERKWVKLHIVGGGKQLPEFKHRVEEMGLGSTIVFHGSMKEVYDLLLCMDVFIFPSRADTVPMAIIEAMCAGLPVFTTGVGDIPYMVEGCGELFEPTVESLHDVTKNIINGKYDLRYMGVRSRERYQKLFSLPEMIQKYSDVIYGVLNRRI